MPVGIDAVLLIALSLPIPLGYRILPTALAPGATPYWLFGLYFLLLVFYVVIDRGLLFSLDHKRTWRLKICIIWLCIGIGAIGPLMTAIVDRARIAPVFGVHDIILQLESSMHFLLDGKNPYAATYFGTPMEEWHYAELGQSAVNPALYHFVMPPWYLLFPFPFYFASQLLFGFFDGRMPLVFTFIGTLFLVSVWIKDPLKKALLLIYTAFHPALFAYLLEGRSDHFAYFWFLLALFLIEKKHVAASAIVYGLALGSKQTIWLSVPFVMLYAWGQSERSKIRKMIPFVVFLSLTALVLVLPFLLWDARSYWESTIGFLQGSTKESYPISGYGFGMVLSQFGLIPNLHSNYPFILWQLLMAGPALFVLLMWCRRNVTISRVLIGYSMFLFIFWYFSRYFHNSHLGYISLVLGTGYLVDDTI